MPRLELVVAGVVASIAAALGLAWFLRPEDFVSGESEDPTAPVAETGDVTDPVYVLARVIASEEGGAPRFYQEQLGCACVNFARTMFPELATEDAVIRLALGSAGAFGRQGSGGRRVSTAREPAALQLQIARDVYAGRINDLTGGATQWDSPRGERALLAQGDSLTKRTPEEIAQRRIASGYYQADVPGIDPDHLRFWVMG